MGGNGKYRWSFLIRRSSGSAPRPAEPPPMEFLCPITRSVMSDPVVVSSGQTFDRTSVEVCKALGFSPVLGDGSSPDFSTVFPNLAIKRTILAWCDGSGVPYPPPPDYASVEKVVRAEMVKSTEGKDDKEASERDLLDKIGEGPKVVYEHSTRDLIPRRADRLYTSSSEESVVVTETKPETPLPLSTQPSCYYSSSSSSNSSEFREIEKALGLSQSSTADPLEKEFLSKLKSSYVLDQEQAVISIRKVTKIQEESRTTLCITRMLSALMPLLLSRYSNVQINATAVVVNLSLEKSNKARIMRSGTVPIWFSVTLASHLFVPRARNPKLWGQPLVPWLPSASIAINIFLLGSIHMASFKRFGLWTGVLLPYYLLFGLHTSYDTAKETRAGEQREPDQWNMVDEDGRVILGAIDLASQGFCSCC